VTARNTALASVGSALGFVRWSADRHDTSVYWLGLASGPSPGGEAFLGRVEPFMLNLEPGGTSGPQGLLHSGHEFVMLIEGQLEYEVEAQRFIFEPGDTLLFASRLNHRWRNPGKTPTRVLIVLSGFEQEERPSEYHLTSGKGEEDSEEI